MLSVSEGRRTLGAKEFNFRGHLHLPLCWKADGSQPFDPKQVNELCQLNEQGEGGFYPIGTNQLWHNGIHFQLPRGATVHNIAAGRIVAARLSPEFSESTHGFGSPRFVLVRHEADLLKNPGEKKHDNWEGRSIVYYSLYMHLDTATPATADVPWLRSFIPFLGETLPDNSTFLRVNARVDGPASNKVGLYAYQDLIQKPDGKYAPGTSVACLFQGTIVRKLEGRKGYFQEVHVPSMEPSSVWLDSRQNRLAPIPEFAAQVKALQSGKCARLDYPVTAGEALGHVGLMQPSRLLEFQFTDAYGFHFELFSESNLIHPNDMTGWTLLEDDTDDDALCEVSAIVQKFEQHSWFLPAAWDRSEFLTPDEIQDFFHQLEDTQRKTLRSFITRNTSFWAIDWARAMSSAANDKWRQETGFTEADQQLAERYMWWKECEDQGVRLPARSEGKALVYHYHPLALMNYIHTHLPALPLFFVTRNLKNLVVARPGDITTTTKEKVFVHEGGTTEDWLLGRGAHYAPMNASGVVTGIYDGIMRTGAITLYEALHQPATTPGVPADMTPGDKRIWASLSHNEGALDAINTWDNAFLSFGPIQQTAGTKKNKGELGGAFDHLQKEAAAAYDEYFKKYSLIPVDVEGGVSDASTSYFSLDGKTLEQPADKEVLRDFIWAYRCIKAMADVRIREPFLEHAFKRLAFVRDKSKKIGDVTVRVGDLYGTELALSLLVDTHINSPALFNKIWLKAAQDTLGLPANQLPDVSTITQQQELDMCANIIQLRESGVGAVTMNDARIRSAHVVSAIEDLTDDMCSDFGFTSKSALKTLLKLKNLPNFLKATR